MELITLHYKFNHDYTEGPEIIRVVSDNFEYKVCLSQEDFCTRSVEDIYNENFNDALQLAACRQMKDLGKIISDSL